MSRPLTTTETARLLNVRPWHLLYQLKIGRIPMPERDSSLSFLWDERAIAAARKALAARPKRVRVTVP
jgi:hypothetical protein